MENDFSLIAENLAQVQLIERKARELWIAPDDLADAWIGHFSDKFREIWNGGDRVVESIEEKVYRKEDGSNYADMISKIVIW